MARGSWKNNSILDMLRRTGVELYSFITTPFVFKNCLAMLGTVMFILSLTFWWLKCYTQHGDSVKVPEYIGMNIRDASRKARARNFGVAISDSVYVQGKSAGEIVAQDPKPGSDVKEGRTIYFTVNKSNPDIIKLPDLAGGDDYELYSRKIARLGLTPRVVARMPDPRLGPNVIIDVIYHGDTITRELRQGVSVEMGSTIDFVVSEEVVTATFIPDCVGQTLDAAKFLIEANGLLVGSIIPDETTDKYDNEAYVYRQTPKFDPNGSMKRGEQVDLYISREKPADNN
jgi:beta-lactam-binding protein with PASTA domain